MNTVDRIVKLIKDKGISERQFLFDVGIGYGALSEWKSGKSRSYRAHAYKIAEYFNVSVSYVLCETDDPTPPDKKEPAPELYPGQAQDLAKLQELAENLNIEDIKALIKYVDYLNSLPD